MIDFLHHSWKRIRLILTGFGLNVLVLSSGLTGNFIHCYWISCEDYISFPHGYYLHVFVCVGDFIVDANVIDEGWMEGRVERTGQYGMLPSNYVEKAWVGSNTVAVTTYILIKCLHARSSPYVAQELVWCLSVNWTGNPFGTHYTLFVHQCVHTFFSLSVHVCMCVCVCVCLLVCAHVYKCIPLHLRHVMYLYVYMYAVCVCVCVCVCVNVMMVQTCFHCNENDMCV